MSHFWIIKTLCSPSMVMANSLESHCQSSCQIVVRVVIRELLSERLLSEWLLSEWLLSEGFCLSGCYQSSCCQRGCCQSGCCQSGCCQSASCQSGCCQSGCCQCRSQAGGQSKSATKLHHASALVIDTARNRPKTQPWDNPQATQNPAGRTRKPKLRPTLWIQKRDPAPKKQPRRKKSADPQWKA